MIINKDLCKKCGLCVSQCENSAIDLDGDGNYIIDQSKCTNCEGLSDIECIRLCKFKAITDENGVVPEFDTTPRLLSYHITWLIAIMGARGNTERFPIDNREWAAFRKFIGEIYKNPDMKVRITHSYDDICFECPNRQKGCRVAQQHYSIIFNRLGIEPGAIMNIWDLVKLYEDKYSIPFMKEYGHDEALIECVKTFVSPDSKFLTNDK